LARYHVNCAAAGIGARAAALALEQSIEMPLAAVASAHVRERVVATVEHIEPLAPDRHAVVLGLAAETTGGEIGQLLNMLFGNCSLQDDVELVDVEFPDDLLAGFDGPRFGLAGIRQRLGVPGRALSMTALKPQGLSPPE